ncbi:MAG: glycolate oxidase subunit GlcE [Gammaproteobacteria bacterium]|nr:glycolate oxidase subunit GlcE [Gammaproteobacteria bacterium]
MAESDRTAELTERIRDARARQVKLAVFGSRSKSWCLANAEGELLAVTGHSGVIEYRPEELVVTVRAGTPLADLVELLAEHGQYLPFEPPRVGGGGTVGGAVAAGLAGPGRPWRGSVRDAVLGVEMLNGLGERLVFGGQVMKNVAGYDLSRLQAGACGTLGVLLSVSLRLLPLPEVEETRVLRCTGEEAQKLVRGWSRSSLPVTATCHFAGRLNVRISGADSPVRTAAASLGGERGGDALWKELRDRALPCFERRPGRTLWEIACPPAAPLPPADTGGDVGDGEECVVEWAGARRWWATHRPGGEVQAYAAGIDARALPAYAGPVLDGAVSARLKRAFDPDNVLNPGIVDADGAS